MAEDAAGPSSGDQRRRRSSSSSTCSSSSEEQSALAAVSTAVLASSSTCSSSSEEQSALAAVSTAELAVALDFTAKKPHLFCDLNFLESVALILRLLRIKSDATKEMVAEECSSRSPALADHAWGCQRTFQASRMSLALVPPEILVMLITKDVCNKNSSMPYELLASVLSDELEHVVSADACRRLCDRMGLPLLPERGVTMASLESAGWWESAIVRRARAPEGLSTDEDMRRLLDASVVPDDAQDLERDAPLDTAEVPPAMRNLPLMQRLKRNVIAAVDRMDLSPEGMQRSCIAFENQPERQYISLVCATGEGGTKLIFLVDGECATGTRVSLVSAHAPDGQRRERQCNRHTRLFDSATDLPVPGSTFKKPRGAYYEHASNVMHILGEIRGQGHELSFKIKFTGDRRNPQPSRVQEGSVMLSPKSEAIYYANRDRVLQRERARLAEKETWKQRNVARQQTLERAMRSKTKSGTRARNFETRADAIVRRALTKLNPKFGRLLPELSSSAMDEYIVKESSRLIANMRNDNFINVIAILDDFVDDTLDAMPLEPEALEEFLFNLRERVLWGQVEQKIPGAHRMYQLYYLPRFKRNHTTSIEEIPQQNVDETLDALFEAAGKNRPPPLPKPLLEARSADDWELALKSIRALGSWDRAKYEVSVPIWGQ